MDSPAVNGLEYSDPSERYEILGTVGSGGMGVVYRAVDRMRGTEVALKTLRQGGALDILRFKREFRALADITHPNLVTLYELHTAGNEWFFTMELVEGESLLQHVRPHADVVAAADEATSTINTGVAPPATPSPRPGGISLRQRIIEARADLPRLEAALYQLVDGVHALHLLGKLHRDLKPSNVLVDPDGRVVLLDFGLVHDLEAAPVERTGESIAGTPMYMSPEQACDGPLTRASDWYSLGVILYEMLTGRRPFEGPSRDVLLAKQTQDPPWPSQHAPGTPAHLDRLCNALLARDPARRPDGPAILEMLGRVPSVATLNLAGAAPPFVGRTQELAALHRALVDSRSRGVAVFVRGASGMGKSAMLRHFLDEIADEAVVLEGRCYERESVPYKALDTVVDALANHLTRLETPALHEILPREISALARLFPVLRRVPAIAEPAVPMLQPPDPLELRRRGFGALRGLLRRLAADRPVVIAIDDLQWGDRDSATFLADLIHHPKAPPILLVACHRSEDERGNAVLATARGSAAAGDDVRELTIGAMTDAEALELLSEVGGPDGDEAGARALVRDCGGSPFFLTALARGGATAAGDGGMAPRLESVLIGNVARLPDDARALLQLCAVAARPLATDVALRAARLLREGSAVVTLRTERLVRVRRTRQAQQIEPYHDRIRETVVAALAPEVRRDLHRSLAEVLETDGRKAGVHDHEALVEHWLEAGEPMRAGAHAAQAAQAAEDALAFHRAAQLYALALAHGVLDDDARRLMQTRMGHALAFAGRLDEAATAYATAAAGASREEALELRRLEVEQRLRSGQFDQAMAGMHDLLAAVGYRLPTSRAGSLASIIGQSLILKLRGDELRARPKVALTPEFDRRVHVLWSMATGMAFVNPVIGRILQLRLMRDALDSGDKRYLGIAITMNFGYLASSGVVKIPQVEAVRDRGLVLAEELDDPLLHGWVEGGSGISSYLFGRWKEADERLRLGHKILREQCTGVRWQLDIVEIFMTANLWLLGDTNELIRLLPLYLRDAVDRGDHLAERGLRGWRGNVVWLVLGQPEEAQANVDKVAVVRQPGDAFQLTHYYEVLARAQIAQYRGDFATAYQVVATAWKDLEKSMMLRIQSVLIEGWYLRGRGALAMAAARPPEAEPYQREVERAAKTIERTGAAWGQPLAAMLRATLAHQRGDDERAKAMLIRAIDGFVVADMAMYAAAARRRLGALLGGDEGDAIVAAATAVMTAGQVADPATLTAMMIPGW